MGQKHTTLMCGWDLQKIKIIIIFRPIIYYRLVKIYVNSNFNVYVPFKWWLSSSPTAVMVFFLSHRDCSAYLTDEETQWVKIKKNSTKCLNYLFRRHLLDIWHRAICLHSCVSSCLFSHLAHILGRLNVPSHADFGWHWAVWLQSASFSVLR